MNKMKKQLAVAVTVALLALPLGSALAQESSNDTPVVVATTTTSTTIATTELQALELLEAAEVAVTAYEAGEITTLAEVTTAEGLKAAAVTAVEAVSEVDVQTALELRVTTRTAAILTAKTTLSAPVVDPDGEIVIPSTEFSDFIDKLQLALAFDPAHKGQLTKQHALRKLAQAQKLMKDGKTEASKICFNQYKDKIAEAQAFLLEVEDTDSETAKALAQALVNVEADNVQVLTNLVDKLSPQAAQKVALNVVRTMEKAVDEIKKEEVEAIPVVTPVVTPIVLIHSEQKDLEKQAKIALTEFKRSVYTNDKYQITDQKTKDDQCTTEQKEPEMKQKWETQNKVTQTTVTPVKKQTTPTYRASDNNKDDRNKQVNNQNKQDDHKKDNGGDNRRDHN